MKPINTIIVITIGLMLSSCITPTGQIHGISSGVELSIECDGAMKLNLSGDSKIEISEDGTVKATSVSSTKGLIELLNR